MSKRINSISGKLALSLALLVSVFAGYAGYASADVPRGAVYTLTNSATANAVAVFDRSPDGTLTPAGTYSTGGTGTGSGLGSQGALAFGRDEKWLFAANAGSNEISTFSVDPVGITYVDRTGSGGMRPISITVHKDLLYVLNAGGSGNIMGFNVNGDGTLSPLPGSARPLSSNSAGPAQVQFSPDGRLLVVTEKVTNSIDTYVVGKDGYATGPTVHASAGNTPFGFAFNNRGQIIVSEAFGGATNASATSSYEVARNGDLTVVSASAPTHQTAACWTVTTRDSRYAYVANAGSGSVTGYSVAADGSLALLNADGRTGITGTGSTPVDMGITPNSRYLYVLGAGSHAIHAFAVQHDGSLTSLGAVSGLPSGPVGLVAR